jgi:hypothetical protein
MASGRSRTAGTVSSTSKNSASFGASMNRRLAKPTTCSSREISSAAIAMKLTIWPTEARPASLR